MNKIFIAILILILSGCNVSPLSPRNNNKINNQSGTIEDIKNNQNGLMADLANVRGKLELMARDVENLQQGLINSNNKNYGIQIFQGEGGLIAGVLVISLLGFLAFNYRSKAEKYKKVAEIMGGEIKSLNNKNIENEIFMKSLSCKVEEDVYKILKK
jgi:hypothetical protein